MPTCTIQIGSIAAGQTPGARIDADTIISWTPSQTAQVTTHPVEDGSMVSDNITREPRTGSAQLMFTPFPSSPDLLPSAGLTRPEQAFTALVQAMQQRSTVFVVIDGQVYDPAAITSVSMDRNQSTYARIIDVQWTEIVLVQAQRTQVRVTRRVKRRGVKQKQTTQPTRADLAIQGATALATGNWAVAAPSLAGALL
jgi:hypothetical protein